FCLWKFAPPQGWTAGQLDDYMELYLEGTAKLKVDFEIADALKKMTRLRLVEADGERYRAVPIDEALRVLDEAWDSYFLYNPSPTGSDPGPTLTPEALMRCPRRLASLAAALAVALVAPLSGADDKA